MGSIVLKPFIIGLIVGLYIVGPVVWFVFVR